VDKDRGKIPCMDLRIILLTMRLMMLVAADRGERIRDLEPLGILGLAQARKITADNNLMQQAWCAGGGCA